MTEGLRGAARGRAVPGTAAHPPAQATEAAHREVAPAAHRPEIEAGPPAEGPGARSATAVRAVRPVTAALLPGSAVSPDSADPRGSAGRSGRRRLHALAAESSCHDSNRPSGEAGKHCGCPARHERAGYRSWSSLCWRSISPGKPSEVVELRNRIPITRRTTKMVPSTVEMIPVTSPPMASPPC